jgi:hypothetical protein
MITEFWFRNPGGAIKVMEIENLPFVPREGEAVNLTGDDYGYRVHSVSYFVGAKPTISVMLK